MKFKKGDIVRIRKDSEYFGLNNQSHDSEGNLRTFKIDYLKPNEGDHVYHCITISASEEYSNFYRNIDLELVEKKVKLKHKNHTTMKNIKEVLEKVYSNEDLRQSVVPLFIGNPGMGKTKIIEAFAKDKGVELVELITSQMNPFEISGIAMPDKETQEMKYYNFDKLEKLKDGDILFFDELLNGNPIVLNACLTILEQRRLISGKALPKVMIVAAANPQGMVPITPQIKERFLWYNVMFDPEMWKEYMYNKYDMPYHVSQEFCERIKNEKFMDRNFNSPRSLDKAVNMVKLTCPTPYEDLVLQCIDMIVENHTEEPIKILNYELPAHHSVNYGDILTGKNPEDSLSKFMDYEPETDKIELFLNEYKEGCKLKTKALIREMFSITVREATEIVNSLPKKLAASEDYSKAHLRRMDIRLQELGCTTELVMIKEKPQKLVIYDRSSSTPEEDVKFYLTKSFGIEEELVSKFIAGTEKITILDGVPMQQAKDMKERLNRFHLECSIRDIDDTGKEEERKDKKSRKTDNWSYA